MVDTSRIQSVRILLFQRRDSCSLMSRNYHSLRHMHVRGDQDSHQVVRGPLTTAQESRFFHLKMILILAEFFVVGWWKKDEPVKINEPWTREKHHVHAQSEMTKLELISVHPMIEFHCF